MPPCRSCWRWPTRARGAPCWRIHTCSTASTLCTATSRIRRWRMHSGWPTPIPRSCWPRDDERPGAAPSLWRPSAVLRRLGLHAAIELILAGEIDAQAASVAQIIAVRAEANVHHVLVAHLLHELDRRAEVAVLGNQKGNVIDVVHGIGDQVGCDQGIELLFRRDRDAAHGEVARSQPIETRRTPQDGEDQESELVLQGAELGALGLVLLAPALDRLLLKVDLERQLVRRRTLEPQHALEQLEVLFLEEGAVHVGAAVEQCRRLFAAFGQPASGFRQQ